MAFTRHPATPYAGPFLVFLALLALMPHVPLGPRTGLVLWIVIPTCAILWLSRDVLEFRPACPVWSVLVGVGVFAVWVGPDFLIPGWRNHWLFSNAIVGQAKTSLAPAALQDPVAILLRSARAVLVVPVLEELFWRGWLMRWIANPDFRKLPLGQYDARAFWLVALLFAMEHGSYWEVGFAAGAIYNWWMLRTRRLSDLILAHAVTNACLCWYVVAAGHWEYWL